jgi:hypothetical protein
VPSFDSQKSGKLVPTGSSDWLAAAAGGHRSGQWPVTARPWSQVAASLHTGLAVSRRLLRAVRLRVRTEAGVVASTLRAVLARFRAASVRELPTATGRAKPIGCPVR